MVHILAARRSYQYAAGHSFHPPCPFSIMGHSSRTVFFSTTSYALVSSFTLRASLHTTSLFLAWVFAPHNRLPEVVICSPSHPTKYSPIVQSCYSSPDHRLTLVFCRVLCSRPFTARIVNHLHTPIVHTYALVVIMSFISTPNQLVIGLSFPHFLFTENTSVNDLYHSLPYPFQR